MWKRLRRSRLPKSDGMRPAHNEEMLESKGQGNGTARPREEAASSGRWVGEFTGHFGLGGQHRVGGDG